MLGLCCHAWTFSSCGEWGICSSCGVWASPCVVFSCFGTPILAPLGFSNCGSQPLEYWLSSCGALAWFPGGMWNLPRPGIRPVTSTLAGGFLTTGPPGKSIMLFIWYLMLFWEKKKIKIISTNLLMIIFLNAHFKCKCKCLYHVCRIT